MSTATHAQQTSASNTANPANTAITPPSQKASVFEIAEYMLRENAKKSRNPSMSTMKLHKLLYFAQGWSLAFLGEPLFDEEIHAWKSGPVIPVLFALHTQDAYSLEPGDISRMLKDPQACNRVEAEYARQYWPTQENTSQATQSAEPMTTDITEERA